jgi:hypothetical protein
LISPAGCLRVAYKKREGWRSAGPSECGASWQLRSATAATLLSAEPHFLACLPVVIAAADGADDSGRRRGPLLDFLVGPRHLLGTMDDDVCPLCCEPYEAADRTFQPCSCDYQVSAAARPFVVGLLTHKRRFDVSPAKPQHAPRCYACLATPQVCMFCWHKIREIGNGQCPGCRTPYSDQPKFRPAPKQCVRTRGRDKRGGASRGRGGGAHISTPLRHATRPQASEEAGDVAAAAVDSSGRRGHGAAAGCQVEGRGRCTTRGRRWGCARQLDCAGRH